MEIQDNELLEHHARIRYRLVYHLMIFFMVLMFVIGVVSMFGTHLVGGPNFLASGMCAIGLVILKYTKRYKLVGAFCSLASMIIILLSYVLFDGTDLLTPLWMIVDIIFTFFILGNIWGVSILICNFLYLFYYMFFCSERQYPFNKCIQLDRFGDVFY